jgi:hypothetical protein
MRLYEVTDCLTRQATMRCVHVRAGADVEKELRQAQQAAAKRHHAAGKGGAGLLREQSRCREQRGDQDIRGSLLPIITAAGFDRVWFGVILTIDIHPPVGLNIYIVNAIAPDVSIVTVMLGTIPLRLVYDVGNRDLVLFPEIATWLPDHLMDRGG